MGDNIDDAVKRFDPYQMMAIEDSSQWFQGTDADWLSVLNELPETVRTAALRRYGYKSWKSLAFLKQKMRDLRNASKGRNFDSVFENTLDSYHFINVKMASGPKLSTEQWKSALMCLPNNALVNRALVRYGFEPFDVKRDGEIVD